MTLKEIRKVKGLTQEEASRFLNVPLRTYKRYDSINDAGGNIKIKYLQDLLLKCEAKIKINKGVPKRSLTIIGAGFVGYNIGIAYSKMFDITFVDNDEKKVKELKKKYNAFTSINDVKKIDIVMICLPTDYDKEINSFKVKDIEKAVAAILRKTKKALIIIKSTIPVGFTNYLMEKFSKRIYFVPEFLREKTALEDVKKPMRTVIGGKITDEIIEFDKIQRRVFDVPVFTEFMSSEEAEMLKLASNAYLAMRIAFFNELDGQCISKGYNAEKIIKSLGRDQRIGDIYNNPSFGYSGYCLTKDIRVLQGITESKLLNSVIDSNEDRKVFIAKDIVKKAKQIKKHPTIGIYDLDTQKHGNEYRLSSSLELYEILKKLDVKVLVFDKNHEDSVKSLEKFKEDSDLIVCNSIRKELSDIKYKVYTRAIK